MLQCSHNEVRYAGHEVKRFNLGGEAPWMLTTANTRLIKGTTTMTTASNQKTPVILTGNEQFDRFLMDEMSDGTSLIARTLKTKLTDDGLVAFVSVLEAAFDAGRVVGQEDVDSFEFDTTFRAPVAH